MSHTNVFVLDQESAKAFYTEKLGLELRFDITMGEEFEGTGAGFRWLPSGRRTSPTSRSSWPRATWAGRPRRRTRGVTFLSEPAERPYGIEAMMRDDSGNMISLVQPAEFDGADAAAS